MQETEGSQSMGTKDQGLGSHARLRRCAFAPLALLALVRIALGLPLWPVPRLALPPVLGWPAAAAGELLNLKLNLNLNLYSPPVLAVDMRMKRTGTTCLNHDVSHAKHCHAAPRSGVCKCDHTYCQSVTSVHQLGSERHNITGPWSQTSHAVCIEL